MRLLGLKRTYLAFVFAVFIFLMSSECFQIVRDHEEVMIDHVAESDCGVVLTGGPGRIREAIEILNLKKIKKLVISGVYKEAQLNEIFPLLPFYKSINPQDIILEKRSESTFGNAVQSLAVVQSLQCKNILLITSQMHMHRAAKIFKTIYPDSILIRQHSVFHSSKENFYFDLLIETFKSVFYIVFGRVL